MAITLNSFMAALSGQESGGNYSARNPDSGAYGKFQIMPANWPSWSAEAGIPGAPQTPKNQERVARHKIQQYYNKFGNWGDVASAWYSGRPLSQVNADAPQNGYPSIRSYVNSVLERAGGDGGAGVSIVDGYYSRRAVEIQKQIEKIDEELDWYKSTKAGIRYNNLPPGAPPGASRDQIISWLQGEKSIYQTQLDEVIPAAKQEQIDGGGDDSFFDRESLAQGWVQIEQEWARIGQGDEQIDQGWADLGISQIHADVAKGRLELDRAMAMIEERLAKQAEARQRATFIEDRLAEASRWAPQESGKTDYSGTDVSAAHGQALAQRGFDPEATVAKYSGTRMVDPAGTLASQDQYMGVGQKGTMQNPWQEGDEPGSGGSQIPGETDYSEAPGPVPPGAPDTGTGGGGGGYGSRETGGAPRGAAGPTFAGNTPPRGHPAGGPSFAGNTPPPGHPAGSPILSSSNSPPVGTNIITPEMPPPVPSDPRGPNPRINSAPHLDPIVTTDIWRRFGGNTPPPGHPAMRQR